MPPKLKVASCVFCSNNANSHQQTQNGVLIKETQKRFLSVVQRQFRTKFESSDGLLRGDGLGLSCCTGCYQIVESFCTLHDAKCLLEMKMNWMVQQLQEVISRGREGGGPVPGKKGRPPKKDVEDEAMKTSFRKEFIKESSSYLSRCAPKVLLEPLDVQQIACQQPSWNSIKEENVSLELSEEYGACSSTVNIRGKAQEGSSSPSGCCHNEPEVDKKGSNKSSTSKRTSCSPVSKCSVCKQAYPSPKELQKHIEIVRNRNRRRDPFFEESDCSDVESKNLFTNGDSSCVISISNGNSGDNEKQDNSSELIEQDTTEVCRRRSKAIPLPSSSDDESDMVENSEEISKDKDQPSYQNPTNEPHPVNLEFPQLGNDNQETGDENHVSNDDFDDNVKQDNLMKPNGEDATEVCERRSKANSLTSSLEDESDMETNSEAISNGKDQSLYTTNLDSSIINGGNDSLESENKSACSLCQITFESSELLDLHDKYLHTNGDHVLTKKSLKKLGLTVKSLELEGLETELNYVCGADKCGKSYMIAEELENHSDLHGEFSCRVCDKVESYALDLIDHKHSIDGNEVEPEPNMSQDGKGKLWCSQCNFKTEKRGKLVNHLLKTHLKIQLSTKRCPICSKSFEGVELVPLKHYVNHHDLRRLDENEVVHRCDVDSCCAYFLKQKQLRLHLKQTHKLREKCQDCGKSSCDSDCLFLNATAVHGTRKRKFVDDLKRHSKSKKGKKDIQMSSFEETGSSDHEEETELVTKMPAKCLDCGISFKMKKNLQKHQRKLHPHFCSVQGCHKKYITLADLDRHINTEHSS